MIVKLVDALLLAMRGASKPVSAVVLHVTERLDPSAALGWTKIRLFAVTAVVLITHVPVEALVAQEKEPAGAAEHATKEGLAPLPAAAQFVLVSISEGLMVAPAAVTPLCVREIAPVAAMPMGAVPLSPALPTEPMGNCPDTSEARATALLVTACVEPAKWAIPAPGLDDVTQVVQVNVPVVVIVPPPRGAVVAMDVTPPPPPPVTVLAAVAADCVIVTVGVPLARALARTSNVFIPATPHVHVPALVVLDTPVVLFGGKQFTDTGVCPTTATSN